MVKEVIKANIVDRVWGDLAEIFDRSGRHDLTNSEWEIIKQTLEIAYEAGYKEGLDQGREDAEWEASSRNGFDGRE